MTSRTLISFDVAKINFLIFSALEFSITFPSSSEILVTPSTKSAISLPNSLHYFWAKKSLEKNYHVIIDKPATLNFRQAKDLIKLAKKKRKLLSEAVVFQYHYQIDKSIK